MQKIDVVRESELKGSTSTRGITRDKAFESDDITFSHPRVPGGVVSDWHHHAARNLYGFVVSGRLRLEYGSKGEKVANLEPGDFFHIPPGLVHRDVNPDKKQEARIMNILLGKGLLVVEVSGPEG